MEILAVSDIHSARPLGHPPFGILSHHVQILDVGKVYRCMEQINALREAQKLKPFHVLDLLQKNIERGSVVLIFGKYSVLTYIVYGDQNPLRQERDTALRFQTDPDLRPRHLHRISP